MKKLLSVLLLPALINTVKAHNIESGRNVVIDRPLYEDLYVTGGTVTINAPVYGDVIIAGGNLTLNDTVTNDVILAGGTATINGYVGDDIRCAAGKLNVGKGVGGDLIVTGGRIEIGRDVVVSDGLMSAGGDIVIDGIIRGNVAAYGGTVLFNGAVGKDLDCRGGEILINGTVMGKSILAGQKVVIGNNASFNNDVRYWSKQGNIDFRQAVKKGKPVYDASLKMNTGRWYLLGFTSLTLGLFWYLGMALLMIAIIQFLFTGTVQKAADTVYNATLKSAGYGLAFIIGIPVSIIVLMVTVIGIPVAVILLFAYITLVLLATVITSVIAANWLNNRNNYNWNFRHLMVVALGLFILLKLVSYTPFFGPLVMVALVSTAFGAILLNINWRKKQQKQVSQPQAHEVIS